MTPVVAAVTGEQVKADGDVKVVTGAPRLSVGRSLELLA